MDNDITEPIGTISAEFVHAADGGALVVVAHGTIYTLTLNVYKCEVCGETMDVTDYDRVKPKYESEGDQ